MQLPRQVNRDFAETAEAVEPVASKRQQYRIHRPAGKVSLNLLQHLVHVMQRVKQQLLRLPLHNHHRFSSPCLLNLPQRNPLVTLSAGLPRVQTMNPTHIRGDNTALTPLTSRLSFGLTLLTQRMRLRQNATSIARMLHESRSGPL
jgi:hypothetical protein